MVTEAQQAFLDKLRPTAEYIASKTGLHVNFILGQAAQETGWGAHLAPNNYWGISPVVNGRQIVASYPDLKTGADAYIALMNSRYPGVARGKTADEQSALIGQTDYNPSHQTYGNAVNNSVSLVATGADNTAANAAARDKSLRSKMDLIPAPPTETTAPATQATPPVQPPAQAPAQAPVQTTDDPLKRKMDAIPLPPAETPPTPSPYTSGNPMGDQGGSGGGNLPPPTQDTTPQPQPPFQSGYSTPGSPQAADQGIPGPPPPQAAPQQAPSPQPPSPDSPMGDQGGSGGSSLPTPLGDKLATAGSMIANAAGEGYASTPIWGLNDLASIYRGAQETGVQAGKLLGGNQGEQVMRDIVSIPDAFAGSPYHFVTPAPRVSPAETKLGPVADTAASVAPAAAETKLGPVAAPAADTATADAAGGAAGAQKTPAGATTPAMTAREALAERTKNERLQADQTAKDRAGPDGKDFNVYVEGYRPSYASSDPNGVAIPGGKDTHAQAEKTLISTDPEVRQGLDARKADNNDILKDHFLNDAQDANAIQKAEDARNELGNTMRDAALKDAKPANPEMVQALSDDIDRTLKSGGNKDDQVTTALNNVKAKLFKDNNPANGIVETDPGILYQVRQGIAKSLSSQGLRANPGNALARGELTDFMGKLDSVIEKTAPGYKDYMTAYADASKPIDTMKALQDYWGSGKAKSITNAKGIVEQGRVQKMINDLVERRAKSGVDPAKNIPDEVMQRLFRMKNELDRDAYKTDSTRVGGSDTMQLITSKTRLDSGSDNAANPLAAAGREVGTHMVLSALPGGGFTNALYGAAKGFKAYKGAKASKAAAAENAARQVQLDALKTKLLSDHPDHGRSP